MKVFVAGATGAIGKPLLPLLLASGYQVVAMTRSPEKAQALRELYPGPTVEPVIADGLDRTAVIEAVARTRPEVIVHQMTGLARMSSLKKFDDEFELTNRLRTTGTDYLLEAARVAGTRRVIAQSYGGWNYERAGEQSRPRMIPSTPTRRRPCAAPWQRFATYETTDRGQALQRAWAASASGPLIDQVAKPRLKPT